MATVTTTATATPTPKVLKLRAEGRIGASDLPLAAKMAERQHLRERLAGAFRIFAALGYDEGVAGHISVRDVVDPHAFWVNPYGVPFDGMTAADLLLVDHGGRVLAGGRPGFGQVINAAGFAIHAAIHRSNPHIHAAAHSHSFYGRAFSCLGRNVELRDYDGAKAAHTVKLYGEFGGVVLDDQEGRRICAALGEEGTGVILQNHGILTVGATVDAAVAFFVRLEGLCRAQLEADAAGGAAPMPDAQVRAVFARTGGEAEAYRQAQELYEWIDDVTGGDYK